MYIYIYIYIHTHTHIHSQKDRNVPSLLLPIHQWLDGNSCTWARDNIT